MRKNLQKKCKNYLTLGKIITQKTDSNIDTFIKTNKEKEDENQQKIQDDNETT